MKYLIAVALLLLTFGCAADTEMTVHERIIFEAESQLDSLCRDHLDDSEVLCQDGSVIHWGSNFDATVYWNWRTDSIKPWGEIQCLPGKDCVTFRGSAH